MPNPSQLEIKEANNQDKATLDKLQQTKNLILTALKVKKRHKTAVAIGCPIAAFDCEAFVKYVLSGDIGYVNILFYKENFDTPNQIKFDRNGEPSINKPNKTEILCFEDSHYAIKFPNGKILSREGSTRYGMTPLVEYTDSPDFVHLGYGKIVSRLSHYVSNNELEAMSSRAYCKEIGLTYPYGEGLKGDCEKHFTFEESAVALFGKDTTILDKFNKLNTLDDCKEFITKHNLTKHIFCEDPDLHKRKSETWAKKIREGEQANASGGLSLPTRPPRDNFCTIL